MSNINIDMNCLEVFGGNFKSLQDVEKYMEIINGKPEKFMEELYLQGDFVGHIEYKFFDKKENKVEELLKDFPYGEKIVEILKAKFADKLKRKVNTIIVIYDFSLSNHFSRHSLKQMKEKKTDEYHIFNVENVYPYK